VRNNHALHLHYARRTMSKSMTEQTETVQESPTNFLDQPLARFMALDWVKIIYILFLDPCGYCQPLLGFGQPRGQPR
jgi:hypothetical protein